jgi:DNA repair protein RecN (Recombination protein N)
MLQYLKISNLALLDSVTLEIDAGFSAVTGETGAGKSILLGALGLLSGGRTDKGKIRQGSDLLEVEGALYFENSESMDARLAELELPPCEDGVLVLRRTIHRSKMPKVQINGSLATLSQLQVLGESWIDFHGPGEPQKLFKERHQLQMLDVYAGQGAAVAEYAECYRVWRTNLKEIETLESSERLDAEAVDFVRQQIAQMNAVDLSEASIEALERDFNRMSKAQELIQLAQQCEGAVNGEDGLAERLSGFVNQTHQLSELDPDSESLSERANSLQLELQDLGEEIGRMADDFDFDAEAIGLVNERMQLWQELRRKHGGTVELVLAKREELAGKLALQDDLEGVLNERRAAAEKMEEDLRKQAEALGKARTASAKVLGKKAGALLEALGFKKAQLAIEIMPLESLADYGDCACRFVFAANAGQDLMPLNKIASSGETARVMLALKTVLAEADATPLLVFDEVDANVGGEVGRAVGAELARLGNAHQVFCVTHLPQVAALAQQHFLVTKTQDADSTEVEIGSIHGSEAGRIDELARMLGDRNSDSARAHAKELLGN